VIAIAGAPRETSKDAIAGLAELSLRAVVLTGDNQATAWRVAAEIGIVRGARRRMDRTWHG
jgi:P-type E1-E2 ATPase